MGVVPHLKVTMIKLNIKNMYLFSEKYILYILLLVKKIILNFHIVYFFSS